LAHCVFGGVSPTGPGSAPFARGGIECTGNKVWPATRNGSSTQLQPDMITLSTQEARIKARGRSPGPVDKAPANDAGPARVFKRRSL